MAKMRRAGMAGQVEHTLGGVEPMKSRDWCKAASAFVLLVLAHDNMTAPCKAAAYSATVLGPADNDPSLRFDTTNRASQTGTTTTSGSYVIQNQPDREWIDRAYYGNNGVANQIIEQPGNGSGSFLYALNKSGTAVGAFVDPNTVESSSYAFGTAMMVGPDGTYKLVATTTGNLGAAMAINDAGVIVGQSARTSNGIDHAFIDTGGVAADLNDLIAPGSGLTLFMATDINDQGQILGLAYDAKYQTYEYLLTPTATPEPTPLALIGLAAACWAIKRRRSSIS